MSGAAVRVVDYGSARVLRWGVVDAHGLVAAFYSRAMAERFAVRFASLGIAA